MQLLLGKLVSAVSAYHGSLHRVLCCEESIRGLA